MSKCKYLAVDPGNSTGWAAFTKNGDIITFDTAKGREAVYQVLASQAPELLICEDYRLFPWKAKEQSWSSLETVRIIGAIEYYAWLNKVEIVLQEPKIKKIGYLWAGITPPKNHALSHETDAYVHGVYYLQSKGVRYPQQGRAMNQ